MVSELCFFLLMVSIGVVSAVMNCPFQLMAGGVEEVNAVQYVNDTRFMMENVQIAVRQNGDRLKRSYSDG